jgi:hypothetical protein
MIQQVNAPPLAFEKTVRETLTAPLAQHGFECEETFPLYANEQVEFTRFRQGVKETVWVGRNIYNQEEMTATATNDEVDAPRVDEDFGNLWASRHLAYVRLAVNYGYLDLFPTGKIAYSRTDENLWHFTDEADLARRLRDEALPMILDAGLKCFDEELEDELDLIERGISTPYRPPDAA